jgi:hypothetical protein
MKQLLGNVWWISRQKISTGMKMTSVSSPARLAQRLRISTLNLLLKVNLIQEVDQAGADRDL